MKKNSLNVINTLLERYPALAPCGEEILRAADNVIETYRRGGKLLLCGNGGSAADAEHIAGELGKRFLKPRPLDPAYREALSAYGAVGEELCGALERGLPAIALTGHISLSTAFALMNFAQQVSVFGAPGDALIAISTSGNAKNCLYAAVAAKAKGMSVILLSGKQGGIIRPYADTAVVVPETETYKIQELHLPIYHALCAAAEEEFFG